MVQPPAPVYPDLVPATAPDEPRVERMAGSTWTISGGGYEPGAEIHVWLLRYQTDTDLLNAPVVAADANGHYSMQVTLSAGFAPGRYGVLVWSPPFQEEAKRHAIVDVVAPA